MEKKINNVLMFTGKDGSQLVYRVLFTSFSERYQKDYAVFYNEKDENDLIAFSFDENYTLSELEEQGEFDELELMLQKYDEEQAQKN